jgi:hypothetical protein
MSLLPARRLTAMAARGLAAIGLASAAIFAVAPSAGATTPAASATSGWVRVGHFSPTTGPVDVYVDGQVVGNALSYEDVTPYVSEADGSHSVALRLASSPATAAPLASLAVTVTAGSAQTVAAVSGTNGPTLKAIPDDLTAPASGQAEVRVVALDDAAATLQASLTPMAGTTPVSFGPITYGTAAGYQSVGAGTYNLSVTSSSGAPLIAGTDWPVAAGSVASIVVATSAGKPTIEVLRDAVGASVLPMGAAQTGFGGTADWGQGGERWWSWVALAMGAVTAGVLAAGGWRRRRPSLLHL